MEQIFDLNGSDTSWLVYADYLEDQGIDATYIREGVAEPQTNSWYFESLMPTMSESKVGGATSNKVGGCGIGLFSKVGSAIIGSKVGTKRLKVGNGLFGASVGTLK